MYQKGPAILHVVLHNNRVGIKNQSMRFDPFPSTSPLLSFMTKRKVFLIFKAVYALKRVSHIDLNLANTSFVSGECSPSVADINSCSPHTRTADNFLLEWHHIIQT